MLLSYLARLFSCCWFFKDDASVNDDNDLFDQIDGVPGSSDYLIGSFNCKSFGEKTFNDKKLMETYYKILQRYDLVFLQEFQDKIDDNFMESFIEELNQKSQRAYKYCISNPLGRGRKERLLYIYRDSVFTHLESFQYSNGVQEEVEEKSEFERDPFVIHLRSKKTAVSEFAVIGVHLYYKNIKQELDALVNVYNNVIGKWDNIPVVIMGNFMADGRHLSRRDYENCLMKKDAKFKWIIKDDTDTTTLENTNSYDRIIVVKEELYHAIVKDSPSAFRFDDEYQLTTEEARRISDHYPVEFLMRGNGPKSNSSSQQDEAPGHIDIDDIEHTLSDLQIFDADCKDIRIGAFNIQRLTPKKLKNIKRHLLKIFARYDLLFIQEVQIDDDKLIENFVDDLKRVSKQKYIHQITAELGRNRYKERYLCIYREDVFEVIDSFTYDDGSEADGNDTFSREPYVLLFKSTQSVVEQFAIIGCHIAPKAVKDEVEELVQVHKIVKERWGDNCAVVMMGDFNAAGSYLSKTKKKGLTLWKDKSYHWLLDNVDTTVAKGDNNYDRIIVHGEHLYKHVHSAQAFRLEHLNDEEIRSISDHFPVEFLLKRNCPAAVKLETLVYLAVKDEL